jgi:hypothetical protein
MTDDRGALSAGQRSPAYPQYGLRRAGEMVKGIYEGAHRAEIGNEAAVSLMGFKSVSGPSSAAIGALKQFGLLEGRDPKLRVTSLTLAILEPLNDGERRRALKQAASSVAPFADFFREFGDRRPAENVLRSLAVRRYGFSGSGADKFVAVYLDTLDYLLAENAFHTEGPEPVEADFEQVANAGEKGETLSLPGPEQGQGDRLEFRLSPESKAVVIFTGKITQQAIQKLSAFLEMAKDTYPES